MLKHEIHQSLRIPAEKKLLFIQMNDDEVIFYTKVDNIEKPPKYPQVQKY
ncbi:hypothetical protein PEDI_38390 [Persicobacter diffluens]|uniref:Uncharacterized protein n=1 Tax=Persicobacter diffluens TaxID=981 RepID=A0AAN4W2Z1_9BACT|nr:hypothetical protein PEDI_38390 [Persicobacter diffluens]